MKTIQVCMVLLMLVSIYSIMRIPSGQKKFEKSDIR